MAAIIMACLMDGRPLPKPAVKIDEGPECSVSDAPAQPAEAVQGESGEPDQVQAAESPEQPQPKAQKDADVPYSVRRAQRLAKQGGVQPKRPERANVGHAAVKARFR
jgi:hypothetical protein